MELAATSGAAQSRVAAVLTEGLHFAGFAAKMMTVDAVRGLGNALRHDYDGVDLRVIWKTVRESLPALKADCSRAVGHPK